MKAFVKHEFELKIGTELVEKIIATTRFDYPFELKPTNDTHSDITDYTLKQAIRVGAITIDRVCSGVWMGYYHKSGNKLNDPEVIVRDYYYDTLAGQFVVHVMSIIKVHAEQNPKYLKAIKAMYNDGWSVISTSKQ